MHPALASLLLVLVVAIAAPARASEFAGAWTAEGDPSVTAILRDEPGGVVRGTIESAGERLLVEGRIAAGALLGRISGSEGSLAMRARVAGARLEITVAPDEASLSGLEAETIVFVRAGGAPAPAPAPAPGGEWGEPAPAPPRAPGPAPAPRTGFVAYRHPIGFALEHPQGWRIEERPGAILLAPPDAVMPSAQQPGEAYVVLAAPAPGVARPDDPRVAQHLAQMVAQSAPFLRPTGAPARVPAGAREGALYAWEGTGPTGAAVVARAYVTILEGHAVGLIALGERARVLARDETLRAIFSTFDAGRGDIDPALVGRWYTKRSTRTVDHEGNALVTVTVIRMDLGADGRVVSSAETGVSGPTVAGVTDPSAARGRWAGGRGRLWITWEGGGTVEHHVHVQGAPGRREMLLTPAYGGEKQLWTETPDQQ